MIAAAISLLVSIPDRDSGEFRVVGLKKGKLFQVLFQSLIHQAIQPFF